MSKPGAGNNLGFDREELNKPLFEMFKKTHVSNPWFFLSCLYVLNHQCRMFHSVDYEGVILLVVMLLLGEYSVRKPWIVLCQVTCSCFADLRHAVIQYISSDRLQVPPSLHSIVLSFCREGVVDRQSSKDFLVLFITKLNKTLQKLDIPCLLGLAQSFLFYFCWEAVLKQSAHQWEWLTQKVWCFPLCYWAVSQFTSQHL